MSRSPVPSVPGYKGFIPGKKADGVFGKFFFFLNRLISGLPYTASNKLSNAITNSNRDIRDSQNSKSLHNYYPKPDIDPNTLGKIKMPGVLATLDSPLSFGGATFIYDNYYVPTVPGYCGSVAGKNPEAVIGKTFRQANEEAGIIARQNQQTRMALQANSGHRHPTYHELRGAKKTQLWGWSD